MRVLSDLLPLPSQMAIARAGSRLVAKYDARARALKAGRQAGRVRMALTSPPVGGQVSFLSPFKIP